MSTTTSHTSELDTWLPDHRVVVDLRRIIESDANRSIEYDSGVVTIPLNADYEVISKAFIKQPSNVGFGCCFRAVVAIGGSNEVAGILNSKFGFATIWYSASGLLITTDFSEGPPV